MNINKEILKLLNVFLGGFFDEIKKTTLKTYYIHTLVSSLTTVLVLSGFVFLVGSLGVLGLEIDALFTKYSTAFLVAGGFILTGLILFGVYKFSTRKREPNVFDLLFSLGSDMIDQMDSKQSLNAEIEALKEDNSSLVEALALLKDSHEEQMSVIKKLEEKIEQKEAKLLLKNRTRQDVRSIL